MFGIKKKKIADIIGLTPLSTVNDTITQIHNAFDIAGDIALAEANRILNEKSISAKEKEEAATLRSLGFKIASNVQRIESIQSEINKSKEQAEIVQKYRIKYPQYKFIFKDQVESICKKYNLVCGEAELYKGNIPSKNIKEIVNFKVRDEDIHYIIGWSRNIERRITKEQYDKAYKNYERELAMFNSATHADQNYHSHPSRPVANKIPFYICAPESDMETKWRKKEGVFLKKEIPDPIVLHWLPEGYLIVSKWGLEGQDPELVNEIAN
jgi:hypothetical protein